MSENGRFLLSELQMLKAKSMLIIHAVYTPSLAVFATAVNSVGQPIIPKIPSSIYA